jgi:hypothetical protein
MPNLPPDPTTQPLVVRPRVARRMLGDCSADELYEKIKSGEIQSYLDGRRRLIVVASIEADIARRAAAAATNGFERERYPSRAPAESTGRQLRVSGASKPAA